MCPSNLPQLISLYGKRKEFEINITCFQQSISLLVSYFNKIVFFKNGVKQTCCHLSWLLIAVHWFSTYFTKLTLSRVFIINLEIEQNISTVYLLLNVIILNASNSLLTNRPLVLEFIKIFLVMFSQTIKYWHINFIYYSLFILCTVQLLPVSVSSLI